MELVFAGELRPADTDLGQQHSHKLLKHKHFNNQNCAHDAEMCIAIIYPNISLSTINRLKNAKKMPKLFLLCKKIYIKNFF